MNSYIPIIIVNFNCGELLAKCVQSVLSSSVPVQVFVSDNGSTDGSIDFLEKQIQGDVRVQIHKNESNIGFSAANNRVVPNVSGGEYILFLNPDCVIGSDTIELMVAEMGNNADAGMSGCLICNPDGTEQAGSRRRVPTPWRTIVRIFYLDKLFSNHPRFQNIPMSLEPLPDEVIKVEAISGAFMLVRRAVMDEVGLLDEGYFLHCEDLDWCMRFRQKGWKILFVPTVNIIHYKGSCSKDNPIQVEWHKHRGMLRFYRIFFRHQYPWGLMALIFFAVWFRFTILAIKLLFRKHIF